MLAKGGLSIGVLYVQLYSWSSMLKKKAKWVWKKWAEEDGVSTIRSYGVKVPRSVSLSRTLYVFYGLRLFKAYVRKRGMPDIIHVHSIKNAGFIAVELKRRFKIPFIVTEHSSAFTRGMVDEKAKRRFLKVVEASDRCVAVSSSFAGFLESFFRPSEVRWEYIPNPVSPQFLSYPFHVDRARVRFRFLAVASLVKNKGLDILLLAFRTAFSNEDGVELLLGGDGPDRVELEGLANDLGLSDRVHFLGRLSRDQVLEQMAASDCLVSSSFHETFGVVLIEALALGRPVIATKCGGPESIVEPEDGYLVTPGDPDEMAGALKNMYAAHKSFDARAIRSRCKVRFGEELMVRKYTELYKDIVAETCG